MALEFLLSLAGAGDARIPGVALDRLERIRPELETAAREWGIPVALLAAIVVHESAGDPNAINPSSGARGLMQLMPFRLRELGITGEDWRDPLTNLRAGARLLVEAHGLGRESVSTVLAGYGGFVTVDPTDYIRSIRSKATALAFRHGYGLT